MKILKDNQIGELVAADYRTAAVFKKYDIDFCCNGKRTIGEACVSKNVEPAVLIADLNKLNGHKEQSSIDYQSWPLDLLADYIEKKHHRYVEEKTPFIKQNLDKLCRVHGKQHPELFDIAEQFNASAGELAMHMKKEELVLFPHIRKMVNLSLRNEKIAHPPFGTVQNPIDLLMKEHDTEGDRFRHIESLSNRYTPPADGCATYQVTFALLKEFEIDLHLHVHLENNILFPKAIELERELKGNMIHS